MASDTYAQHHKAISLAFQVLYGLSFADIHNSVELEKSYLESLQTTQAKQGKIYGQLAWELVLGVYNNLKAIDAQITRLTLDQTKDALTKIELTLLRLGVFELFFKREISYKIVLDEIITLNRNFGAEEETANINPVLQALSVAERSEKQSRHKARLLAIQILYALSFLKEADADDLETSYANCLGIISDLDLSEDDSDLLMLKNALDQKVADGSGYLELKKDLDNDVEQSSSPDHQELTHDLVFGVVRRLADIDGQIKRLAQNWRFERIGHIELTLLRLAIFELFFIKDLTRPAVHLDELDDQITNLAPNISLTSMSPFALALLRLASFEIFFSYNPPRKVVINEALELCTKLANSGAKKFINGLLDAAKKELEAR